MKANLQIDIDDNYAPDSLEDAERHLSAIQGIAHSLLNRGSMHVANIDGALHLDDRADLREMEAGEADEATVNQAGIAAGYDGERI